MITFNVKGDLHKLINPAFIVTVQVIKDKVLNNWQENWRLRYDPLPFTEKKDSINCGYLRY
jgi:hypothetical protein